eukprot:TRINITY_DN10673_c0_g1_i2.p1 TRINITY_DN10673_c0_g1~~TRINITY_DN10673_c0_g1_i2.p1  ORF type:complete len:149 (-),score=17.39 TRINITY_DN10673_c0_g1_i2:90-536(-)
MDTKTVLMPVKSLRYTHNFVFLKFSDGRRVCDTVSDLQTGKISIDDIPPIRVILYKSLYWSLDNRRLHVFKEAGIETVPVLIVEEKNKSFFRKMTTGIKEQVSHLYPMLSPTKRSKDNNPNLQHKFFNLKRFPEISTIASGFSAQFQT